MIQLYSKTELKDFFEKQIKEMDEQHNPILVTYADSIILQKIHYGDSELINRLKFYPYLQIIVAALFIILGYIGFSSIKKSEQSNIWVGMAKGNGSSVWNTNFKLNGLD